MITHQGVRRAHVGAHSPQEVAGCRAKLEAPPKMEGSQPDDPDVD
jgi:hypothetical protein